MNIKKALFALVAVSLLATPMAALAQADPDPDDADAQAVGFGFKPSGLQGLETGSLVTSIVSVINALLVLAAIAAVVFMIIGGVRYVTSQGDEDAVAQAKNTVIYAIIGVIVILLAAVIINFFISAIQ